MQCGLWVIVHKLSKLLNTQRHYSFFVRQRGVIPCCSWVCSDRISHKLIPETFVEDLSLPINEWNCIGPIWTSSSDGRNDSCFYKLLACGCLSKGREAPTRDWWNIRVSAINIYSEVDVGERLPQMVSSSLICRVLLLGTRNAARTAESNFVRAL